MAAYMVSCARGKPPAGRKQMALGLDPLCTKGGGRMTDYELIVLVIMIVTLAFSIHNGNPKG